eukprot:jgi/Astpho2/3472/e_gw1.00055.1.1_t
MANTYRIAGHSVTFPHKAYGTQLTFMERVLRSLSTKANALLEAPTGSGKTLSLLCAALAWQHQQKIELAAKREADREEEEALAAATEKAAARKDAALVKPDRSPDCTAAACGIKQEPGAESQPPTATPGSSEHRYSSDSSFADPSQQLAGEVIRELKRTIYRPRMAVLASREQYCIHPTVSRKSNKDEECDKLIKEESGCSCKYFKNVTRLYPMQTSSALNVHDIEDLARVGQQLKACPYFAARHFAGELKLAELIFCPYTYLLDPVIRQAMDVDLKEAVLIFDEAHNIEDVCREAASAELEHSLLQEVLMALQKLDLMTSAGNDIYLTLAGGVGRMQHWLQHKANSQALQPAGAQRFEGVWAGKQALAELAAAGLGPSEVETLHRAYEQARQQQEEEKRRQQPGGCRAADSGQDNVQDYRLAVQRWMPQGQNAGVREAARCVVLTSGTLAPMDTFASELGTGFPLTLEAPHVVDMKRQVWAGAVSAGPDGSNLNATYRVADTTAFQDSLGQVVLTACRIVPDGILMFLPSYSLMNKLCSRWQATGTWAQICALKTVVSEPRGTGDNFDSCMAEYYAAIKSGRGGLMMAVCRGKVSEGLDFTDGNARAVLLVGIPFPNVKDTKVNLKKKFNDQGQRTRGLLSGDQWYCQQAFRALNQAIGRCIRHRLDYGAILLIDERFQQPRNQLNLSRW